VDAQLQPAQALAKIHHDGEFAESLTRPADPASAVSQSFRGALLLVSALFLFACMDTATKYLSTQYNVPFVVAIRYVVHCLLMTVILAPIQGK